MKTIWSKQRANGITEYFDSDDYGRLEAMRGIINVSIWFVFSIIGLFWMKYWVEVSAFIEKYFNMISWLFA